MSLSFLCTLTKHYFLKKVMNKIAVGDSEFFYVPRRWHDEYPGGYSLIWLIRGCAAGPGMVFRLFVLNGVDNTMCLS